MSEPLTKEQLVQRLNYCVNGFEFNGMPETAGICREAIAEIESLRQDLARYENAHKVLVAENKRLADRVANLDEALREAMEWNWCDDDMNQGVRAMCQRALGVTPQAGDRT